MCFYKKLFSILTLLSLIMAYIITPTHAASSEQLLDGTVNVGCVKVTDAIQIANSADLLIVDGTQNKLYKVNFFTSSLNSVALNYIPNSVDYFGSKIFVGCGTQGVILIYDTSSLALIDTIQTGSTFSDLAIGNDGYIYTIGSGYVRSISVTGKNVVSNLYCSYSGTLERNPSYNSFYFTRTGVSPSDVHVVTYENGILKSTYD